MCNACGFQCCGSDYFSGCGCYGWGCEVFECSVECDQCGQLEDYDEGCLNPKCIYNEKIEEEEY